MKWKKCLSILIAVCVVSVGLFITDANALKKVKLSKSEMKKADWLYFDRCTGCHGILRKGATGPSLLPEKMSKVPTAALAKIIYDGTDRGMPGWGEDGVITKEEAELLAKYIQLPVSAPPEMSLAKMKKTWEVLVPVNQRPTKVEHGRNLENFVSVILRDVSKVAIIDGDTKEVVSVQDTGFAVHTLRYSFTGRYLYTIARDGIATMIDLWSDPIKTVAKVRVCHEGRSVDSSKYKGPKGDFLDKLAIVGCYWPPSFVILDGQTLEPLKIVNTRGYTYDTNEYHPEVRVASIVASRFDPLWIVTAKESGKVLLVDYSDLEALKITTIDTERFLHDGGWDATGRYFIVAANMRNSLVVVDAKEHRLEAIVKTGNKPHPGRGANLIDPKYGPVFATPHIGEALVTLIGTDPDGAYKRYAWKVVRKLKPAGSGGLFIKTHPRSKHLWVDHPKGKGGSHRQISVFDITNLDAPPTVLTPTDRGRVVHFEYNKAGDEVWVSIWDKKGEIVVYDDRTLRVKTRITDPRLSTPTGKFNLYNTVHDVY